MMIDTSQAIKNHSYFVDRVSIWVKYSCAYRLQVITLLSILSFVPASWSSSSNTYDFAPLNDPRLDLVGGQWKTEQDNFGFLWFGGAGGLARYDGYNVLIYRHDPDNKHSLSGNYVTDLLVDSKGILWVASRWGLNKYNHEKDTFTQYYANEEHKLSHNFVWTLYEDKDGHILAGTGGGLDIFQPDKNQFSPYIPNDTRLKGKSISAIFEDNSDKFWVGTENSGVFRFNKNKQFEKHFEADATVEKLITHNNIRKIYQDNHKHIWVGTYNGLNRYLPDEDRFTTYFNDPHNPKSLGGNIVRSIIEDKQGKLWFGIDGAGLNYYVRNEDAFFRIEADDQDEKGLINNKVRSIFEDKDGGMWVGHFPAGVSFLDKYASAFQNYKHNPLNLNSLSNSDILSVFEDRHKHLWVGTERGLNYLNPQNGKIIRYEHDGKDPSSLQANPVLTVFEDSQHNIWVGTWGGGLSKLNRDSGKFLRIDVKNAKEARFVYETKDGTIWVGTEYGLNRLVPGSDVFKLYTHDAKDDESILPLGVNGIYVDSRNTFWVASDTGVATFDPDTEKFRRYTHDSSNPDGLGPGYFTQVTEDSSGNIWLISGADGVNRYDPETKKFQLFRTQQGLSDDIVGGVIEDEQGFIWISTGRGISRFNPGEQIFDRTYTTEHGLPGNLFKRPAVVRNYKGDIVLGSTKGLTIFNPQNLYQNTLIPEIVLTDFQIFYKPIDLDAPDSPIKKKITSLDEISLTHKQSVFSFEFSALNFTMPHKNQYAYKLEGFDNEWIYAGKRRTASYTNLDAGKYVLKVKGSNNEGVWNENGHAIQITILPPWWKTWWAYIIYVLAACTALAQVILHQIRERQLVEEQNRILEQKVSERTAELQKKNHDIQAMLTNMHQGLLTIEFNGKLHSEYSHYLEVIFEQRDLGGLDAIELLFGSSTLDADKVDQVRASMFSIVGDDVINFDFNSHALLTEYEAEIHDQTKKLTLDWNPILTGNKVSRLMVTVRDVTELREAEAQAIQQQRELDIVAQLIAIHPQKFIDFENSVSTIFGENHFLFGGKPQCDMELIKTLFRRIHTVKGNSRTYQFRYLSEAAHEAENYLNKLMQDEAKYCDMHQINHWHDHVEQVFNEYRHIFYDVIHHGKDGSTEDVFFNERYLGKIQKCLSTLANEYTAVRDAKPLTDAQKLVEQALSAPIEDLLADLIGSLKQISKELGKQPPQVKIDSSHIRIKAEARAKFADIFTHLLRNSIDHGLESPTERQSANKPENGEIKIICKEADDKLLITIGDDGRGLNLEALRNKGTHNGAWPDGHSPSADEIAELIFTSGLSTKSEVSNISGRGVGMDAVREVLRELGGNIRVRFTDPEPQVSQGVPFVFLIELPLEHYCK